MGTISHYDVMMINSRVNDWLVLEQYKKRRANKLYPVMKRNFQGGTPKAKKQKKKYRTAKIPRLGKSGFPSEKKYFDVTTVNAPTYNSATSQGNTLMTSMVAGTGDNNIIGDSALLKGAGCNITITCAATTGGSAVYRVIMVYGRSPTSLFIGSSGITQFQDIDYTEENVVLYDKMKTIDSTSQRAIFFRGYKKLNHLYKASANWNVYLIIKSTGTLTTAAPTVTGTTRVRFIDS